ncbi:hypothetical protein [Hyunsoonleella rubra]|uniref:Leucine-rich repeat domain-containing protein n=1 Tax=Hyunsoonleella rubra TaxID=1737062 RepID=A0ABW5T6Y0_9FLAO
MKEFWKNNNIELYKIESPKIFSAKYLQPSYEQEQGLTYSQLKKLRKEWVRVFPKLEKLEYLRVSYLVNQEYFESICQIPNLKGLSIKTSRINDFSSIQKLTKLEQLDFSGSKAISELSGIQHLKKLEHCVLDNFFGINTVEELGELRSLKKLYLFAGIHGQKLNLKSIEPISELIGLEELVLDIKTKIPIDSLYRLKNLKSLIIPEYYHLEVKDILPNLSKLE